MSDYRDNLEIDLLDLLKYLRKKWIALLAVAGIGAILGVGFFTVLPNKGETVSPEREETPGSNLTVKDKMDVDLAYRAYMQCLDLYDQLDGQPEEFGKELQIELIKATFSVLDIGRLFSNDQREYYNSLFEAEAEPSELNTSKTLAGAGSRDGSSIFRYLVAGIFAGIAFATVVYCLKYILSPTIKTEEDLRNAFRLPAIGTMDHTCEQDPSIIVSSIMAYARNSEAQTLCLISDCDDHITADIQATISNMLDKKEMSVKSRTGVLSDSSAIDDISASDGIVLFEKIGESRYDRISREIELCSNSGASIIGTVLIR